MNQRKCAHCKEWVASGLETCPSCNTVFYQAEKEEHKTNVKRAKREIEIPLISIHENDPVLLKFLKRIIQFHQIVFYFILYVFAYLTAAFAG